ncbi:E3 ubiquitin ligase [Coemansia javaensis]|uniref:E3 ubiquitin ligase n=1 Tax=Coemansia javaensis TaxID=2761396 RepID=A0A9W8LH25_9FUNG|nr:E3 ubiquitin ligase [Coemansia javaensis]
MDAARPPGEGAGRPQRRPEMPSVDALWPVPAPDALLAERRGGAAQLHLGRSEAAPPPLPLRSDVFVGGGADAPLGRRTIVVRPPQDPHGDGPPPGAYAVPCRSAGGGSAASSESGGSVYEMPGDVLSELELDGIGLGELDGLSLGELGLMTAELDELGLDDDGQERCRGRHDARLDDELHKLEERVLALDAEMVVQGAELAEADRRFAQIAEALQCSICLDTLAQPHSLACGHTFCQECLVQWLGQSKQCPACRAPVVQRPAVAFAVQDVIRCMALPGRGAEADVAPGAADPWARLFPAPRAAGAGAAAAGGTGAAGAAAASRRSGLVMCSVCSRSAVEGEPCINCAIDSLYRNMASRLGPGPDAAAGARPPAIQISRVSRRPSEPGVERLLQSARSLRDAFTTAHGHHHARAGASRGSGGSGGGGSSSSAAPRMPPPDVDGLRERVSRLQRMQRMVEAERLNHAASWRRHSPSRSPSPPESLFDPADLVEGRRHYRPLRRPEDAEPEAPRFFFWGAERDEPVRRVRVRSPPPAPAPALQPPRVSPFTAPAEPGQRHAYALRSRRLLNDYMVQLDDGDSSADESDGAPPPWWPPLPDART